MTKIIINKNKEINFNYKIRKKYIAGIILKSWEIKGIRKNGFNITNSYIKIKNKNCILFNSIIKPIRKEIKMNEFEERRKRNLLLKKNEIIQIKTFIEKKNITIIPLTIFWKNNFIKTEIAICVGKKLYEKKKKEKYEIIEK